MDRSATVQNQTKPSASWADEQPVVSRTNIRWLDANGNTIPAGQPDPSDNG